MEIFKLFGSVYVDNDKANKSIQKTGTEAQKSSKLVDGLGSIAKKVGGILATAFAVSSIVNLTKTCIEAGSRFEEMKNKFDVVFKETNASMESWSKNLANNIGRSRTEIMEAISNQADLMIGMGMTEEVAGDLSKKYTELAYDLASFNNASDSTAIEAVTKAMFGETEMMKSLGVNLSVTTMQNSEYVKSLNKSWDSLTQAEKAEAYYQEMLKQSVNAVGDAERSMDSYENQTKRLKAKQEELATTFGQVLIPMLTPLVTEFGDLFDKVNIGVKAFIDAKEEGKGLSESLQLALDSMGLESWSDFVKKTSDIVTNFKDLWTTITDNQQLLTVLGVAVGAITTAIVVFNGATILANASLMAQELILNAIILAETIATGVTTAFGVAVQFLTSPITLVILAIGALIAIIYLLVTNWDWVKVKAAECWAWIVSVWQGACVWFDTTVVQPLKQAWDDFWTSLTQWGSDTWKDIQEVWNGVCEWFTDTIVNPVSEMFKGLGEGIASFLTNPLESVKSMFKSAFNWIGSKMNVVIDGMNKLQLPDWVPGLGGKGLNIPRIPALYKGTDYFNPTHAWGNMALVGERGPELVNLPTGSRVNTADETKGMLGGMNITIVSPKSTASDIKRKLKELNRDLAFGM